MKELEGKTDKQAENKFVAGLFICMADNRRYGELKAWLGDDFALGNNKYPRMLIALLALLRDFEGMVGAKRNKGTNSNNNNSPHRAGCP